MFSTTATQMWIHTDSVLPSSKGLCTPRAALTQGLVGQPDSNPQGQDTAGLEPQALGHLRYPQAQTHLI